MEVEYIDMTIVSMIPSNSQGIHEPFTNDNITNPPIPENPPLPPGLLRPLRPLGLPRHQPHHPALTRPQRRPPLAPAVRFNPVLCPYGTRAIPSRRGNALDARWDIPGVREHKYWSAPRVKVIPAQNLTVVEVSLRWHRDKVEMGLDESDPRLQEYLVYPPTKKMLLKVDLCVWDEEAGDIAHVFAQVEVMACPVGLLLQIAEAMLDLAEPKWPMGKVGGDFIKADHVGRAVDMLTCFGGLGEAASLVWGGLKVVMEAKVAIEPYEEEG
ncbi:hypothetical protein M409DRAFT_22232 [Zasmidium cellare ATCC 36951]|uniref:Uncharacterized protein n=1 Tax=Zasmidium cellare ATCC 36951 TaxID=1080233 RepID=A0A6A6CLB8_ZASCE|nr:uncharacterized protein M409DRAFT_22232 [Zasmidium cellare ATCC 36951]KAF2167423.1 hypothetical protein M409DRAFT_22232 [Zasmidium cellare ATCC 36951]